MCQNRRNTNLRRLSTASCLPGQGQQYAFQKLIGLLVVFSDVSIAMKSENARIGANWKIPNVVNIHLE